MKIGFIGLGAMGQPMARNLARAGHSLYVFNRTRARAEALAGEVVLVADSISDAAREAEVVVTMLADDRALEEVAFGAPAEGGQLTEGVLGCLPDEAVHLSMSTISPPLALRLGQAHQAAGQGFVSAPVFGRPDVAEAGKLWAVVAGRAEDIERCRPVLEALSAGHTVVGEGPWLANVVKLAGNFLLASAIEALGEAFALASKSGVDGQVMLDAITSGVPWSRVYEGYGGMIAAQRFDPAGFRLELGLKDMRLALEAADAAAVAMPLLSLVRDHLLEAWARGQGGRDWAVLGSLAAGRGVLGGSGAAGLPGPKAEG